MGSTPAARTTGRRVSLLATASEFVEASAKLNGRTLGEAVEGYLRTVANVKRKDIKQAVEEFIQSEEPRTKARDGQRAQLSVKYAYTRSIRLRKFADTFPGASVCDLTKEHPDAFIGFLDKLKTKSGKGRAIGSAKSRNHYRAAVQQFLQWAVRKDYLAPSRALCCQRIMPISDPRCRRRQDGRIQTAAMTLTEICKSGLISPCEQRTGEITCARPQNNLEIIVFC